MKLNSPQKKFPKDVESAAVAKLNTHRLTMNPAKVEKVFIAQSGQTAGNITDFFHEI